MRAAPLFALLACLLPLAAASALAQPAASGIASFDCSAARAPDEMAVCATPQLGALDIRMATTFDILTRLVAMGQRGVLQDGQRAFLAQRRSCGANVSCIRQAYDARLATLGTALADLASRGPF